MTTRATSLYQYALGNIGCTSPENEFTAEDVSEDGIAISHQEKRRVLPRLFLRHTSCWRGPAGS